MSINELFRKFDIGKKGYLTPSEYEAVCYSLLISPNKKSDKYYLTDIIKQMEEATNSDKVGENLYSIFHYLSDGNNKITFDTLKKQASKFQFTEHELKEMINYVDGEIDYKQFVMMFK
ncbi:calcium binding domain protein [Spraguea lophii 42_110]|uniref:Calcium binding domain protein n=1 Tax=Spraguea lophii (strain 42_110) TaxID=1358809 RepID=S7XFQ1_SPRLO|nr:calcium binding domain protein [Spraguea lophii 42_110]